MQNEITKIGVITYTKHQERVLLNESFVIANLITIIETDPTFEEFEIFDGDKRILYADYEEQDELNKYFNLDRKHYTEISEEETRKEIEALTKKNKIEWNVDGFGDGSRYGGTHEMYTFPKYKGIIVNVLYELNQYGGTKLYVELEHPKHEDHYFNIFESKDVKSIFEFLKRRAGDYTSLIKKEDKRLAKEQESYY